MAEEVYLPKRVKLEICADSIQSVLNANVGGAHRIELCSNLKHGGITPSYGLIQLALRHSKIPIHVLIRPRAGNFCYSSEEIAMMIEDIKMCKQLGCHGLVVGVLTADHAVDMPVMRELMKHAEPLPVTFHRAFDDCKNQSEALEDVISLGCIRILSSGDRMGAHEGVHVLEEMVDLAAGRISIMPGAGIKPDNVAEIAGRTGATEVHASAKRSKHLRGLRRRWDADIWETDPNIVKGLLKSLWAIEPSE